MRRGVAIVLVLALAGNAQAGELPAVAPALFPLVKKLKRPDWIQPGTRLTYFISGSTTAAMVGRRMTGSGGLGFSQIDVVAVSPQAVVLNIRYFLLPDVQESGPAKLYAQHAVVALPSCAGDFWVHPDALAAAKTGKVTEPGGASTRISRIKHTQNDKEYEATFVEQLMRSSTITYVWDNRSGVLLSSGAAIRGMRGSAHEQKRYRSFRQLRLPWARSPMPAWLKTVQRMDYKGTSRVVFPGAAPIELAATMRLDFVAHGTNWTRINVTKVQRGIKTLQLAGSTTTRSKMVIAAGPGMIGGAWVPPAGLADLRTGQVLDRDPHTKFTTSVGPVGMTGGRHVTVIIEDNELQRIEYHYDTTSGGLLHLRSLDKRFHTEEHLSLRQSK